MLNLREKLLACLPFLFQTLRESEWQWYYTLNAHRSGRACVVRAGSFLMQLRSLALAAALAVAAVPYTASAVAFSDMNNIAPGATVDVAGGPYFFDSNFTDTDAAGIFDFTFTNNSLGVAAVTMSEGTVLQNTLDFLGGVTAVWLNGGASAIIAEGATMGWSLTSLIQAGSSDTLRISFGDPRANVVRGRGDIDFDILVQPIPLPASALMLLGALGGLGVISRRRREALA
jgi:hypothetical protein